jgi:hypothetical protein
MTIVTAKIDVHRVDDVTFSVDTGEFLVQRLVNP